MERSAPSAGTLIFFRLQNQAIYSQNRWGIRTMNWLLVLCLVFSLTTGALGADKCTLTQLASLEMRYLQGIPLVTGRILDRPHVFMVDTGGAFSMLTETAARRLGLPRKRLGNVEVRDAFGRRVTEFVTIPELGLENLGGKNLNFLLMADAVAPPGVDGLLAPDKLAIFEVEFDFLKNKLNLFSPDHCKGELVYWTMDPYAAIPVRLDGIGHLTFRPSLDGKKLDALFDTGASASFMALKTAVRLFKWKAPPPELQGSPDRINNAPVTTYSYPFKALDMGGIQVSNPVIRISDQFDFSRGPHLVVGMTILGKLHLFVSYKERVLYATPRNATLPTVAVSSFAQRPSLIAPAQPAWPGQPAAARTFDRLRDLNAP
jgi:hypothetical protein